MIELVRDLRAINVLAKFENDPWKIVDVRVLTGLVCPAARRFDIIIKCLLRCVIACILDDDVMT